MSSIACNNKNEETFSNNLEYLLAKIAISNVVVITSITPSYWLTVPIFTGVNVSRSNFGSGQFGGSFNAGDNYINFAFNIFLTLFGGQGNQTSGFSTPQPQQQQSNFGNQMGEGGGAGSFGNQGSSFSSNSGAFNAVPVLNLIIKIFEGIRCLIGFLSYLKKILTIHLT